MAEVEHSGKLNLFDTNYVASYDLRDLEFYQKQADLIQIWTNIGGFDDRIIEKCEFLESQLERTWQGQYVAEHKPLKVGKRYDLIVQQGLTEFAKDIILGTGKKFNWIASGDGTAEPMIGDTTLEAEKARMSLGEHGSFKTPAGSVIRIGAFFLPGHVTHTISEAGCFSEATAGLMMNHALFSVNQRVEHKIFQDFYGVAFLIAMGSI